MRLGRERLLGPGAQDTRRCSRRRYRRGCLQECSGCDEPAFAVYGVPDAKKGERLMVLTKLRNEQLPEVLRRARTRRAPPAAFSVLTARSSPIPVKVLHGRCSKRHDY